MNIPAQPPPGDPAWADIRARYEAGTEKVGAIAETIGLSSITLSLHALRHGWAMRGKAKPIPVAAVVAAPMLSVKAHSTRATIIRLKDMLQSRVTQLEQELRDLGAEVDALSSERQIKSVNTLVRTLEKVLDLERKDKLKRKQAARAFRQFDDAERAALADKIERLEAERDGALAGPQPVGGGGGGAEPPVALLGAAQPATAARGD